MLVVCNIKSQNLYGGGLVAMVDLKLHFIDKRCLGSILVSLVEENVRNLHGLNYIVGPI